jgi:hypothetical protein
MSRFGYDYDEGYPGQWELWEANARRAFAGRKGQAALRDMRDALLALPDKVLISGRVANEYGQACAVGVLIAARRERKGENRDAVLAELARLVDEDDGGYGGDVETAQAGKQVGLSFVLAWELAAMNDETFGHLTPEQRYEQVLAWLDKKIMVVA